MGTEKNKPKIRFYWEHGQKKNVALLAGIRKQYLSDILARKKGVSPEMAMRLEKAVLAITNHRISWTEFVLNKTSKHPIFRGLPNKK